MENKAVIYCKRSIEPSIPLTTRIDWLPDGTIKPRMFWTPDGACYKVVSLFEGVFIDFRKERGEGLCFNVVGEVIDTPELDDDLLHTRYETSLYLADSRFCQKNIIDKRYGHAGKEFITVTLDVFPDGDYELVYFLCRGARYKIEKTVMVEQRGSFQAGGAGLWHKVVARLVNEDNDDDPDPKECVQRLGALTLEFNKWFVHVSNTK